MKGALAQLVAVVGGAIGRDSRGCGRVWAADRSRCPLTEASGGVGSLRRRAALKLPGAAPGGRRVLRLVGRSSTTLAVWLMPRISMFYGITVTMYSSDHAPPHFHARYGEFEAQIVISTGEPLAGQLPIRALRLIREWTELHRVDLYANWERAQARTPLASIDPLP